MAARLVLAARNVPAERSRTATLDGAHHLELAKAHMPPVGFAPSGTMVTEDVRDLQTWTGHDGRARGSFSCSSGLSILAMRPVATRALAWSGRFRRQAGWRLMPWTNISCCGRGLAYSLPGKCGGRANRGLFAAGVPVDRSCSGTRRGELVDGASIGGASSFLVIHRCKI